MRNSVHARAAATRRAGAGLLTRTAADAVGEVPVETALADPRHAGDHAERRVVAGGGEDLARRRDQRRPVAHRGAGASVRTPAPSALEPPQEWAELRQGCPVAPIRPAGGDQALARTELQTVPKVLLDRLPTLELAVPADALARHAHAGHGPSRPKGRDC
ncbi:hypothetical protein GCM10020216_035000 [Nonomuraea helvata]